MSELPSVLLAWHAVVATADPAERASLLADLLADDVVFRSPAVHAPQRGKPLATAYLQAAMAVLGPVIHYERQLVGDDSAALEFVGVLDGRSVHGIDLIRWDDEDRVVDFTVLVRPLRGLEKLIEKMATQLTSP